MENKLFVTINFVDGTRLRLSWNEKEDNDRTTIISKVRKGLEQDRFIFEADGELIMIPIQNIKNLRFTPLPKALPKDIIIQGASIVST